MASQVALVFGDEYLVSTKAKEIVASLTGGSTDPFASDVLDAKVDTSDQAVEILAACREALDTLGFLGGGKVVWLKDANFLYDSVVGRTERTKTAVGTIADKIKTGLMPGASLVISATKVDKRSALYRACKEHAEIQDLSLPDKPWQAAAAAGKLLDNALQEAGLRMSGEVKQLFLERVGHDTRTIVNEIAKLMTYAGDRNTIRREDVDAITSYAGDAAAWDIQDTLGLRDLPASLSVLRRLLFQRESPVRLIGLLETRIRELMLYRDAVDRGWLRAGARGDPAWGTLDPDSERGVAAALGPNFRTVHPFRLKRLVEQARRYRAPELRRALGLAVSTHRQLVTTGLPAALILEMFLVQLMGRR